MSNRVIVVGGGICGMAAAHQLLQSNFDVTLLEAGPRLGGLGTHFRYRNSWVDCFYHCIMPTDDHLLGLIDQVGLADQVYWKPTKMGFIISGKRYAFNTAFDLMRFSAIPFGQRIRLGAVALLLRKLGEGKDLDNISTRDFLTRYFGQSIWENVWQPLFKSKFGPHAGNLPALYLWQRLGREKNVATRGYLTGGLKRLTDALEQSLAANGARIIKGCPVDALHETPDGMQVMTESGDIHEADWVVCTAPMPVLRRLVRHSSLKRKFRDANIATQGVINALFFLKRPLENFYWSPVVNSGAGFDGIVEMSALVNAEQYGGMHLAYVMKYCPADSTFFQMNSEKIKVQWTEEFLRLYRDLPLKQHDIADVRLFRAPFVEPIYPLGYLSKKPDFQVGQSRLILANTAQVYPNITSWNSSTQLAKEAVAFLQSKLHEHHRNGTRELAA